MKERPSEKANAEDNGPPGGISGWLYKKAGGGKEEKSVFSFSGLTGNNWKRRWFTLKDAVFGYYEAPVAEGEKGFTRGKGKAIWMGDLTHAVAQEGKLAASSYYNTQKKRTVLNVNFHDRILTLGTAPGEQNQADLGVLAAWEEALAKHHVWATTEKASK